MIALGIGLSVVAACCYAVSATLQHTAVTTVADGSGARLRMSDLRSIARRRRWLLGLLVMCCGAGLHATALSMSPLLVVQPIGVLGIGLTVVLAVRAGRSVAGRTTVPAVLASTCGVVLFVVLAAPGAQDTEVPAGTADLVPLPSGLVIAGLVVAALLSRGWLRCPLFATAAGVAYGTVSVLTRVVSRHLREFGFAGLPWVAVLGGVIAIGVGAWCVQQAYASGRADTVLACQTVVDPFVGVLFGVLVFHEATGAAPLTVIGEVFAAVLAVAGVLVLARRAPTVTDVPVHHNRGYEMNRPLRIVIGADTFPPDINGAARFGHQLASGLAERGHDVHVVCPSDTGPAGTTTMDGFTVHRLAAHRTPCHPTFRICLPPRTGRSVRDLVGRLSPDLVHVQAHFVVGRALVRAAAERDVPVVATNHFMPENLLNYAKVPAVLRTTAARWGWRDLARVFRPAGVVTAPTRTAVDLLTAAGVDHAVPVSCGIDLDRHRATPLPGGARTVLFVGRLDEEKRVHELLHALHLLPERLGVRVEVVGDGACRADLVALAERLGITDRVRFLGFVSDDELIAAYRRSAVFCMPGVAELQSLATMEAMAAGRPVVAADAVALPHLVRPGRNGWLYPPGDVAALADRLTALFEQPGELARMGAASRELVGHHDVRASLDTFEDLYAQAMGVVRRMPRPIAA
jgi:glycosyltransferase involved in cell wall biosynthesis